MDNRTYTISEVEGSSDTITVSSGYFNVLKEE